MWVTLMLSVRKMGSLLGSFSSFLRFYQTFRLGIWGQKSGPRSISYKHNAYTQKQVQCITKQSYLIESKTSLWWDYGSLINLKIQKSLELR